MNKFFEKYRRCLHHEEAKCRLHKQTQLIKMRIKNQLTVAISGKSVSWIYIYGLDIQ